MKQFFKFMFASMAGFILGSIVFFFLVMMIVSGMMMSFGEDKKVTVRDNSVLEMKFDEPIEERSDNNPLEGFDFSGFEARRSPGLDNILSSLRKAAKDDKIKGIFMNLTKLEGGIATIQEIRIALIEFRESGKFIYAYAEMFNQGAYYLATVADKIFLYPEGGLDFRGIYANPAFLKGTLEKLEIQPEIIRHGKFKSAVEPFITDRMSPENREQTQAFMNSIWNNILADIGRSRNVAPSQLQQIADDYSARKPEQAVELKMVDQLAFYDDVIREVNMKAGLKADDKPRLVEIGKYKDVYVKEGEFTSDKIAVVYAVGDIVDGRGSSKQASSERVGEALRKARTDSTVKAIVFRINSPGGSALASDVILREAKLAKEAKPFIVSMGDYAASGGYYIACAADTIVAQPNTITGSIGVFGLLFNAKNMFSNKLGITFDTVRTAKMADIGSALRPMRPEERAIIQEEVDEIYSTFTGHVAEGRGMEQALVDSIGQGRVWSGTAAKDLGLVDILGGLNDAISLAAASAGLDNYRTIHLPQKKDLFEKLLEDLNTSASEKVLRNSLGETYEYYNQLNRALGMSGIQMRCFTNFSF